MFHVGQDDYLACFSPQRILSNLLLGRLSTLEEVPFSLFFFSSVSFYSSFSFSFFSYGLN